MRTMRIALLGALMTIGANSFAQYYGSVFVPPDMSLAYSEIDRERAVKEKREHEEKKERDSRREQEKKEKAQRRRDAKVEYVPKEPTETHLVVNYAHPAVTADQIVDTMIAEQSAAPPVKAPPQKKDYLLVTVGDDFCYYRDGLFYEEKNGEMNGIPAPEGALVMQIPPDSKTVEVGGAKYSNYQDSWFQKVMMGGQVAYKVVANPQG